MRLGIDYDMPIDGSCEIIINRVETQPGPLGLCSLVSWLTQRSSAPTNVAVKLPHQ